MFSLCVCDFDFSLVVFFVVLGVICFVVFLCEFLCGVVVVFFVVVLVVCFVVRCCVLSVSHICASSLLSLPPVT